MRLMQSTSLLLLAVLMPGMAVCDSGVLEINQACAMHGGCFSGDAPGFPVEILNPGSYVLTDDLTVPGGTDGIDLDSGKVSIDLNGFSIRGPVTCSGTPVTSCSSTDDSVGVSAVEEFFWQEEISVQDGYISGFADVGIALGARSNIADLVVTQNGRGVTVGEGSTIQRVKAYRNRRDGFSVGDNSILRDIQAQANGTNGITASETVIRGAVARGNAEEGIVGNNGTVIRDATVVSNGSTEFHDGIVLTGRGLVADSTVSLNAGYGVSCGAVRSGLDGVVLSQNSQTASHTSEYSAGCTPMGDVVCDNGVCP
jgi:hypothetical protein